MILLCSWHFRLLLWQSVPSNNAKLSDHILGVHIFSPRIWKYDHVPRAYNYQKWSENVTLWVKADFLLTYLGLTRTIKSKVQAAIPPAEVNSKCLRKWIRSGKHAVTHPQYSPVVSSDLRFRDSLYKYFLRVTICVYLKVPDRFYSHYCLITFSIYTKK